MRLQPLGYVMGLSFRSQRLNATTDRKEARTLWRPLRAPTFRNLLLADVASDMGTFMQSVGAAWLMISLHAGPLYMLP